MDITVHTRHEVTRIDIPERLLEGQDLVTGRSFQHRFEHLVIATGTRPVRPSLPGIDADNIHHVNSLPGGIALKQDIQARRPESAVIIGGGYIGIEMAEAMVLRGLSVCLIQRGTQVLPSLDPELATIVGTTMEKHGVMLCLNHNVTGFATEDSRAVRVITDQGERRADLFVLGLGVQPNSELAAAAGIPLGPKNAIVVNERQQTERPDIWAAGDCAQTYHLVARQPVHVALGTVANKQGRIAGINLSGGSESFPGVVGTAITKFMDLEIAKTGLNERELQEFGIPYVTGLVEARTLPRYYPGSAPLSLKILAHKESGRLLGAQIVGGAGAGKRIDAVAVALHANFGLEDLLYLDFAYAPPFSGVWEPLVIAARIALKNL